MVAIESAFDRVVVDQIGGCAPNARVSRNAESDLESVRLWCAREYETYSADRKIPEAIAPFPVSAETADVHAGQYAWAVATASGAKRSAQRPQAAE